MYKCTDDVQEKVNEESVNKASYQLDLGGHFCLQKVHAQNMGGMWVIHCPKRNCHHFIVNFQSSINSLGTCK